MDDGCGVADKHGNLLGLTKLVKSQELLHERRINRSLRSKQCTNAA